jgi:hypothetical protein
MGFSWGRKPPGPYGTGYCHSHYVFNDHVGPIKTHNQYGQFPGTVAGNLRLTIALRLTIDRVVHVENAHDGNGPNQTPQEGNPKRPNTHQQDSSGTPHGTNRRIQVRGTKGYAIPTYQSISKREDQEGKAKKGNEAVGKDG